MRVAIVAESFLPQTNGVVHSILRVLEQLEERGHQALVIAPEDPRGVPRRVSGARVVTVRSVPLPQYREIRVATGTTRTVLSHLRSFDPDVVHLASPFALGWRAMVASEQLRLPTVAIFQTDVPGFARRYHSSAFERLLWRRVRDIHSRADLNLVPSSASMDAMSRQGIDRLSLWRRGVDSVRFHPRHRDQRLHQTFLADGRRAVGFIGRLAPEKQVETLAAIGDRDDVSLVIIGDGPERARLQKLFPRARFTGMLHGHELATAMASLDLLIHPGESETFCQVIQEAMASAVAVIAPAAGGPLDLVHHGRTGWLYPPRDIAMLQTRVADLLGDDSKREAMGVAGRQTVLSKSWSSLCAELVGHYETAIARRRDLSSI